MKMVLKHEGLSSNHKDDPGGKTKYGISLRFLKVTGTDVNQDGRVDEADVDCLTVDDATNLYRLMYWEPNRLYEIQDQNVASKCLDMIVNMGAFNANRAIQRAVRAALGLRLHEDGIIGSKSIHAINMCKPAILLAALKSESWGVYQVVMAKRPELESFHNGWKERAYS